MEDNAAKVSFNETILKDVKYDANEAVSRMLAKNNATNYIKQQIELAGYQGIAARGMIIRENQSVSLDLAAAVLPDNSLTLISCVNNSTVFNDITKSLDIALN